VQPLGRFPALHSSELILLGDDMDTIHNNRETPIDASKQVGIEVNVEKTKYMLMSRDQNADQNRYIKIRNRSFEKI
jgi:hypothetical protein